MAPTPDEPDTAHPDAPSGKAAKYALVERERRFLLPAVPTGTPVARVLIEDRYLVGTRIRLRRMTDLEASEDRAILKLTQKIPTATGAPGLITTMYLSSSEYAALLDIPAHILRKIRSHFPSLGVDVFEGPLHGLVLAEAEFDSAAEQANYPLPADAVVEVTEDVRFTGGTLATTSAEELKVLLAEFGIGT